MEPSVFASLRGILEPYAASLSVAADTGTEYSLNTRHIMKNGQPLFFGAVRANKACVSFHLMPIYAQPSLLSRITPELRRHMHGKSCFNFKREEPNLFVGLAQLTTAGFRSYEEQGYV